MGASHMATGQRGNYGASAHQRRPQPAHAPPPPARTNRPRAKALPWPGCNEASGERYGGSAWQLVRRPIENCGSGAVSSNPTFDR